MIRRELSLSLSRSSRTDLPLLFLEQDEYPEYTGKLTKAGMALAVLGWLYPDQGFVTVNSCGGKDGVFTTNVFAYLYQQNLNYTIGISYGVLGKRTIEDLFYIEIIRAGFKDSVDFSYPNEGIASQEWVGNSYNNKGEIVEKPVVTSDKRSIYFSTQVWASLKVKYRVIRHAYTLEITGRQKADPSITENKYDSTAYAHWSPGIDWIDIAAPYGFEDFDGECGNGDITDFPDDDDDDPPPTVDPTNKETKINYCTQEEIE